MKNGKLLTTGGLLAAVAIFILINTVGRPLLRSIRLDLTQNKVHTLSKGTVHILESLKTPEKIQLYWSATAAKDMTSLKLFAQRVIDLLDEYSSVAGGKLTFEVIDPEPFSEAEDNAVRYGVQGVPTGSSGDTLYFGIVGIGKDGKRQVIPFLQPDRESFLEFDLSQMVYSLDHPEKTKVGLLSALPLIGGPSPRNPFSMEPPWTIVGQLRRQYDLKILSKNEQNIPDDIRVLMVVYPQGLGKRSLYAIDQFVLRGGHALVFVDPMSEFMAGQGPAEGSTAGYGPDNLLHSWGVRLEPGKVVGDMAAAQRVSYKGRFRTEVVDYLPWLAVRGNMLNRDEVVTGQIDQINLASAGSLTPVKGARTDFVPLMQSTSQAMLLDRKQLAFPPDPKKLIADFKPAGKPFTLAVRISGPADTAFPDGPPPPEKTDKPANKGQKKAKQEEQIMISKGPINVVVVADTDMLQDRFWVTVQNFFGRRILIPNAGNADLAINAIDQLGG
ncbi:MAG TPA: ABC transporter, partial [Proteobacteria bacterium]|nr:ABC transporter [Pseudomonadota bacterium]